MSVTVTLNAVLDVREQITVALDLVSQAVVANHSDTIGNATTLNSGSSPAATVVSSDQRTLSSGTDTVDLTAAPGATVNATATTIDFTGLKVQAFKISALATNTSPIVIAPGSTNGYNLFGASGQVEIPAGGSVLVYTPEGTPDVSASLKNITVTSDDVDAKYNMTIIGG